MEGELALCVICATITMTQKKCAQCLMSGMLRGYLGSLKDGLNHVTPLLIQISQLLVKLITKSRRKNVYMFLEILVQYQYFLDWSAIK